MAIEKTYDELVDALRIEYKVKHSFEWVRVAVDLQRKIDELNLAYERQDFARAQISKLINDTLADNEVKLVALDKDKYFGKELGNGESDSASE